MTTKEKVLNIPRVITMVLGFAIPTLWFIKGIFSLFKGRQITTSFVISFIAFPCISILLCLGITLLKAGPKFKIITCTATVLVLVMFAQFFLTFGSTATLTTTTDDAAFEKYSEMKSFCPDFPSEKELGQPVDIEHNNFVLSSALLRTDSASFICKYSESDYDNFKKQLEEKYIFIDTFETEDNSNLEFITEIDGYNFRTLSFFDYPDLSYPKYMALIATNDTTHEVVYTTFHDTSLDYIEDFKDFILYECGWKYIR